MQRCLDQAYQSPGGAASSNPEVTNRASSSAAAQQYSVQETDGTHQRSIQDGLSQQRNGKTGVNFDVKFEMSRQCARTRKNDNKTLLHRGLATTVPAGSITRAL